MLKRFSHRFQQLMSNISMKQTSYSMLFRIVLGILFFCPGSQALEEKPKVFIISVKEMVEPGMAAYIKRSLESIQSGPDDIVIFKLDTFGGRVDSAIDIVDSISNIPKGKTIAFVEKRAISAGALIALSSGQLIMKNNTFIGDCAPIISSSEGQQMAGEKVETVLRAKFRSLARKNNYPAVLAESMVSLDMEVYQVEMDGKKLYMDKNAYDDLTEKEKQKIKSKKTIVAKGELLTMDDVEAFTLGFSRKSVRDLDEALEFLGCDDSDIINVEESWSENLVGFLQPLLPILMLIGIGGLYMEMKAPGFGLPGAIGIVCLCIVFFNQYLVGLADYTEFLLLLLGILLMGLEIFVFPGFGLAGISALLIIGVGVVLSLQNFVIPDPSFPWEKSLLINNMAEVLGTFVLAFFLSIFMVRFVLPKISRMFKHSPYLETTLGEYHMYVVPALSLKSGDVGLAYTNLRPSGKVIVNKRKIDAITRGDFVEQGMPVIIDSIEHNKVIVKNYSEAGVGIDRCK
jgi:membrane-bound serine protease (ClpP class)